MAGLMDKYSHKLAHITRLLRTYPATSALIAVFLILLFATLYGVSRPAKHDRDFVEHLSRLPHVELREKAFEVSPTRNWSYDRNGPLEKIWRSEPVAHDFGDLKQVWFLVEPHPGMDAMAHTLVLFEFSDDRLLGLTIEARREVDEKYSAFEGNWGKFELLYVWADARDLVLRRAIYLDKNVEIYPLSISLEQSISFLKAMLAQTRRIENKARLYNTLFSNCTNELGKHGGLKWHPSFILTGYASQHLHKIGMIKSDEHDFASVRKRGDITAFLEALGPEQPQMESVMFDKVLLAHLREKWFSSEQDAQS
ncbi:DUF4105 domain-containing protein [Hirschia litorea]|uniref:DUF4105 domain-containing protein n=1 Tax=Hirschia litorea TaxID=1199156 RepID=A0ABW2IM59_9PROT